METSPTEDTGAIATTDDLINDFDENLPNKKLKTEKIEQNNNNDNNNKQRTGARVVPGEKQDHVYIYFFFSE